MAAFQSWAEGVQRLNDEAAGVLEFHVIQRADLAELLGCALMGEPEAVRLVRSVSRALVCIQQAPRRRPMLCGACPRALRGDAFNVVVVLPRRDEPSNALTLAICHRCGTRREDIEAKATVALRRIWPDLRPIAISNTTGGHA